MSRHRRESGLVIVLVAIVLLFVVGAMAALAIDVVTLYTARSEAQLAADGAALAGARVLANSGMTSNPADSILTTNAEALATTIAQQVAMNNRVGGRTLTLAEVPVSFPNSGSPNFGTNPQVQVRVTRTDLPTFFSRIWGRATLTVSASATAEAYNPSGMTAAGLTTIPIAPACVKPWLLPNIDPTNAPNPIFNPDGSIANTGLLGYDAATPPARMRAACPTSCSPPPGSASSWQYYPGDPGLLNFPPPSASSVACAGSAGFTPYQLAVAGCVQTPIACNQTVSVDITPYPNNRDLDSAPAVNCLAHSGGGAGDSVDTANIPIPPFRFVAGDDNPVVQAGTLAAGTDVFVSDSLVTVPVFDSSVWPPPAYPSVQIVGFVQLFVEPAGNAVPTGGANAGHIRTEVINLAGCGTGATGQAIFGNGASPIPVRLVTP